MKTLVIYHRADFDGIFSREIAKRYFGTEAEYLGWDYGDPVPSIEEGTRVYMIDISIDALMTLPGLVWIDHHKTAIDKYPKDILGVRIDGVAACRLAWQYFFGTWQSLLTKQPFVDRQVSEPWAVRLAGEYDIWDKRDPQAELFQHGLRTEEIDFSELLSDGPIAYVEHLLKAGKALQFARTRENESIVTAQGFTVQWEGRTFIACNAARYNSHLFTAALKPEHDGCLGFAWDGGKRKWRVSLYGVPGKPDVDLSPIAVKYGGGGHRQACGFECAALPFPLTQAAPTPITPRADPVTQNGVTKFQG